MNFTGNKAIYLQIADYICEEILAGKYADEERMKVNITPGLIRISVGLEHRDDILADILQALED